MRVILALFCLLALPLHAQTKDAGFDYYILALSWSANFCALQGDAQNSDQCAPGRGHDWVLHGLWPQYSTGYPADCATGYAPPSRAQTAAMADIMGTPGLAWHQWRKHGTCSGLSPAAYFALSRDAYARITRPQALRDLTRPVTLPARLIEEAFLRDNPSLRADQITITCRAGHIQEARICLTPDLAFRSCGADVIRDCALNDAMLTPMR